MVIHKNWGSFSLILYKIVHGLVQQCLTNPFESLTLWSIGTDNPQWNGNFTVSSWSCNEQSVWCWWTMSKPSISSQVDLISVFVVAALHVFLFVFCGVRSFNKKTLIKQMFCVKCYNCVLLFHFRFFNVISWVGFVAGFCVVLWCRCIAHHHHQAPNKLHWRTSADLNSEFFFMCVIEWIKGQNKAISEITAIRVFMG